MTEFCPATMCPLFAADGSPWSGEVNAPCQGETCGWFHDGHCLGARAAIENIDDVSSNRVLLQIGTVRVRRTKKTLPKTYDCPREKECKWQNETTGLCPPRHALSLGIDPKACAY
jgi:hypothetical protein